MGEEKVVYDFYFSQKHYDYLKKLALGGSFDPPTKCFVRVDGYFLLYTEAIRHGREPVTKANFPDLRLVTSQVWRSKDIKVEEFNERRVN